jgi:thymidylate synthase (FAD)
MITVDLLQSSPLDILIKAIRTCYDSKSDNLGEKDLALIKKIIASKHESTLEHIVFTFKISNISRACLQELARHRIASYSVKSTRYTLKELKNAPDNELEKFLIDDIPLAVKLVATSSLKRIKTMLNTSNPDMDKIKYALPECYKTELVWTINARSLRNFLNLRISPKAHHEIRELARTILAMLSYQSYGILFEDIKTKE